MKNLGIRAVSTENRRYVLFLPSRVAPRHRHRHLSFSSLTMHHRLHLMRNEKLLNVDLYDDLFDVGLVERE